MISLISLSVKNLSLKMRIQIIILKIELKIYDKSEFNTIDKGH